MIEVHKKKSSNIDDQGVTYNTDTKELIIPYKSFKDPKQVTKYKYYDVPKEVWEDLKKADSLGGFVNREIVKGGYRYERL